MILEKIKEDLEAIHEDERGQFADAMRQMAAGKGKPHSKAKQKRKMRRSLEKGFGFWHSWATSGCDFGAAVKIWLTHKTRYEEEGPWYEVHPAEAVDRGDGVLKRRGEPSMVTCPECGKTYRARRVNMIRREDWWWHCRCGADVNNPYKEE